MISRVSMKSQHTSIHAAACHLGCCKHDVRQTEFQPVGMESHQKSDTISAHACDQTVSAVRLMGKGIEDAQWNACCSPPVLPNQWLRTLLARGILGVIGDGWWLLTPFLITPRPLPADDTCSEAVCSSTTHSGTRRLQCLDKLLMHHLQQGGFRIAHSFYKDTLMDSD